LLLLLLASLLRLPIGGATAGDVLGDDVLGDDGAVTLPDDGEADGLGVELIVCASTGAAISADIAVIARNDERFNMCRPPDVKNPLHTKCLTWWIGSIGHRRHPEGTAEALARKVIFITEEQG
jgi:hypothetical protein